MTFNQAGSCVIDANQAGDARYQAAPQAQQTVLVSNMISSELRRGDLGLQAGEETPLPPFGVSRGIRTQMTANAFDTAKMVKRAYKYRFYPTPAQAADLSRTFGCVRKVWNLALQARTTAWDQRRERVTYRQSSALLTGWKRSGDLGYLNEVSSVPLQQALRHLQSAFTRFRDSQARYPRFKSRKKSRASAEYTRSGSGASGHPGRRAVRYRPVRGAAGVTIAVIGWSPVHP